MCQAMVSIILPTYNRADILGKAIESVLGQTYPHFELLVVDDGSTDQTKEAVKRYPDERIRFCRLEQNGGQSKARNYGIRHARYAYLAFEDSDDLWQPDKLLIQMQRMEREPSAGFCYHKIRYRMDDGSELVLPTEQIALEKKSGDIFGQILYENLVPCPALLVKKDCIEAVGGFDESMKALEDYDLALKLSRKYQAVFVDEILLEAVSLAGGVSDSAAQHLAAGCYLLRKYKADYVNTDAFAHRIEKILGNARRIGMESQAARLLELNLR